MFLKAYNRLIGDRARIIADCELMRKSVADFKLLDAEIAKQREETEVVAELVRNAVNENAATPQSQADYLEKYDSLSARYQAASAELDKLIAERNMRRERDKALALFIRTLSKQPLILDKWDDAVWTVMVEKAIVHRDKSVTFVFYNGAEIRIDAE